MKSRNSFFVAILSVVAILSSFTLAQKWVVIGQKQANYGMDRDVLEVRGNDVFKAIKIKVVDAPLDMKDLDIYFENGEKMNVPIQFNFSQGEESRAIDLPGNKRRIKKISFLYDTDGVLRGKANVIVLGQRR
jgi:hypothetical protein